MTKKITTQEYVEALKLLIYVKEQENLYKNKLNKKKKNLIYTSQIFELNILELRKKNNVLKQEIDLKIKNFLKDYQHNPRLYKLFSEKINLMISNIITYIPTNNPIKLDYEIKTLNNLYVDFNILYEEIKTTLYTMYKNELEITNINKLITLRKNCIEIKSNYKQQSSNKTSKTKKRKTKKKLREK